MFTGSSVKVQMLTLCSDLGLGAVYINPLKSLSALEGSFNKKMETMFHSRVFAVDVIITTECELVSDLLHRQ